MGRDAQGRWLGRSLLRDAACWPPRAAELIGAPAMLLYAVDDAAPALCERYGFRRAKMAAYVPIRLLADLAASL